MVLEPQLLARVRSGMSGLRMPEGSTKVYKDECMFSFDNPFSPTGLYLNLKTFQGFGEDFVMRDHQKSKNTLYLWIKSVKVPKEKTVEEKEETPKVLAIGVPGGFNVDEDKYDTETEYHLVIMPEKLRLALPNPDLPEFISMVIKAVQDHQSAFMQQEVLAWKEEYPVTKHAENLPQLDPKGKRISPDPSTWQCEDSGMRENLWLNLSTGYIGSGRRNWDGSGGTGAAEKHYHDTGKKYPLAVKLGTITPEGADVYSYAEDEMVKDPYLKEHLAHWGIMMDNMRKTELTMAELQINLNLSYEFEKISESGKKLVPVSGPGLIGLQNLGNSCYMNSLLQVLFSIPEMKERYYDQANAIFNTSVSDPSADLLVQISKLAVGLLSDRYASKDPMKPDPNAIQLRPQMFKNLVGRGHPEFSSGRQQDTAEYFQYLLEKLEQAEPALSGRLQGQAWDTSSLFQFHLESRIHCLESNKVKYLKELHNMLELHIPLDRLTNAEELEAYKEREKKRQKVSQEDAESKTENKEEPVKPKIPFGACLEDFAAVEKVSDYYSAAIKKRTEAEKTVRFKSFPKYLAVKPKRYEVAPDWTIRKLDALVEPPERLDLEHLRALGPQNGEELMPDNCEDDRGANSAARIIPDESIVEQLMAMGFTENACKRAALAVNNESAERSIEWVFQHMDDADLNDPLPEVADEASSSSTGPSADLVAAVSAMGFTERQASAALSASNNNPEMAVEWLFSHSDDLESAVSAQEATSNAKSTSNVSLSAADDIMDSSKGTYSLLGFISHMGSSTASGHYVAHILKDIVKGDGTREKRWVIFNDEKVALSEDPPKALGYVYLYKRED